MPFLVVVFVVLPSLLGLGMLVAAARARRRRSPVREGGTSAIGTVVDNRRVEDGTEPPAPHGWYLPVVEFRTANGRRVRTVGDLPARRPYRDGVSIGVVYDPRDAKRITVGAERSRVLAVGAAVCLAISALMAAVLLVVV